MDSVYKSIDLQVAGSLGVPDAASAILSQIPKLEVIHLTAGQTEARAPLVAWYTLFVLTLASFLSFLDRHVLMLLSEPIKKNLALTDVQVGILQGSAIALFTAAAAYPVGWLADRFDRRLVLVGCISLWSIAVVSSGLSESFNQLLLASGMVAFGEAGLGPITYALIPLLFIGAQRQFANSLFAVTAIGGGALAMALAGQLIEVTPAVRSLVPQFLPGLEDWQFSFLLAALPAPLLILLVLTLKLPARPAANDQANIAVQATRVPTMFEYLKTNWQTLAALYIGGAMAAISFGATGPWIAIASARLFSEAPAAVGAAMGFGQIISAIAGFSLSLIALRIWGQKLDHRFALWGVQWANVGMIVTCLSLPFISSAIGLYVFYGAFGAFLSLSSMLAPTLLQSVIPVPLMGRAVSLQLIATMLLAALPGPLVGAASEALKDVPNGMMIAMASVAIPTLLISTLLRALVMKKHFDATVAYQKAITASL